jgi:hypothetical protein
MAIQARQMEGSGGSGYIYDVSSRAIDRSAPNQAMKPTALLRCKFSEVVASPRGGLSYSR